MVTINEVQEQAPVPELIGEYLTCNLVDPKDGVTREVFLHECEYVLQSGYPINKNKMIAHKDNNLNNNKFENLIEVPELNDHVERKNKIFQVDVLEKRKEFIKEHFPEIYDRLELSKKVKNRDYYIQWLNSKHNMEAKMKDIDKTMSEMSTMGELDEMEEKLEKLKKEGTKEEIDKMELYIKLKKEDIKMRKE